LRLGDEGEERRDYLQTNSKDPAKKKKTVGEVTNRRLEIRRESSRELKNTMVD